LVVAIVIPGSFARSVARSVVLDGNVGISLAYYARKIHHVEWSMFTILHSSTTRRSSTTTCSMPSHEPSEEGSPPTQQRSKRQEFCEYC
jgi:hypothetical protein